MLCEYCKNCKKQNFFDMDFSKCTSEYSKNLKERWINEGSWTQDYEPYCYCSTILLNKENCEYFEVKSRGKIRETIDKWRKILLGY